MSGFTPSANALASGANASAVSQGLLIAVVGLLGRFTDPAGLELTSLALAAIMVGAALVGRRVRPAA